MSRGRGQASSAHRDIASFFVPACKRLRPADLDVDVDCSTQSSNSSATDLNADEETGAQGDAGSSPVPLGLVSSPVASVKATDFDIADYVALEATARQSWSSEDILELIRRRVPHADVKLPTKEYTDSKRKSGTYTRSCSRSWFDTFAFLVYSEQRQGLFCLPCVLFPVTAVRGTRARILIRDPLVNWKNALADLRAHENLGYHLDSMARLLAFRHSMEHPAQRVDQTMSESSRIRVQQNREILISIVKSLELCGRQGLALRGHRDDATNVDLLNKGKLKAIIDFRVDAGDTVLGRHLVSTRRNATYISKTSQNDLLDCMASAILETIVQDVKASHYYSVLADEAADVSGVEQLGVAVQFIKDGTAKEKLVKFVACDSVRGVDICRELQDTLKELGLDVSNCRGQGYDGAGAMSGEFNGCQALFQEFAPFAKYYHCANHQLNLALSRSSSVREIHCMLCDLKALGVFFKFSPKRQKALEEAIKSINAERRSVKRLEITQHKFKLLCETRWVERHTTLEDFADLYEPLLNCLEEIAYNTVKIWDAKSVTEANGLLRSVTSAEFIAAFQTTHYFLGFSKSLSIQLQGSSKEILEAYQEINLLKQILIRERADADEVFKVVYGRMVDMAKQAGTDDAGELPVPRRCRRQTLRSNVPSSTSEEYWRRTVFCPYLDNFISELSSRFSAMTVRAVQGLLLIPGATCLTSLSLEKEKELLAAYETDLPSPHSFSQEMKRWKTKWSCCEAAGLPLPYTLVDTLAATTAATFPNIHKILTVMLVSPVTTATVERSISALGYVKSKLRSTMGQERLNALLLLFIHKDVAIDYEAVVDAFARKKPRRMLFTNPLDDA